MAVNPFYKEPVS